MLRKIDLDQLTPGMYVARLDRSWLDVPIFRHRITSPEQVRQLRQHQVREVFIDTEKGDDVAASPGGDGAARPPAAASLFGRRAASPVDPTPFEQEIAQADRTFHQALDTISSAMEAVGSGGPMDLEPVNEVVDGLIASILRNRDAMTSLATLRGVSEDIYQHCVRVSILSLVFANHMGVSRADLKAVGLGAILHDVGKVDIPAQIRAAAQPLTQDEFKLFKKHPLLGARKLKAQKGINKRALMVLLQHHERADGSGYPLGLQDDEILELAKVVMVADTYDKLTMREHQGAKLTPYEALAWIREWGGRQFSKTVVDGFEEALGLYPVGSFVRLSDNSLGIVLSVHHNTALMPKVWLVFDGNHRMLPDGRIVDLANQRSRNPISIVAAVKAEDLGIDLAGYVHEKRIFESALPADMTG